MKMQKETADDARTRATLPEERAIMEVRMLNAWYGAAHVLKDITLDIMPKSVTAFIGPSGCGKSTLLRCFNRMNDLIPSFRCSGSIMFGGADITSKDIDPVEVRLRIGMVFQKPNPFPKSIYENVVYGPRLYGIRGRARLDRICEERLKDVFLWDEVKDKLNRSALELSGGQQQRLCIARALAMEPDIVLLDEPCSALDPIATARIEELMLEIKKKYTVVIVTHNMQQAARVSDFCAFLYMGELVEYGATSIVFTKPSNKRTEQYITGRFG